MGANTFGNIFKITTFGESHGVALGVVIDGCPAGVAFDMDLLVEDLKRRRPGASKIVTGRGESDTPEVLSGVFEGKTLGTPIAVVVRNHDAKSKDYSEIKNNPRKGHADDMWRGKFGHSDYRGGGRSSGRETLCRVIAGSIAKMALKQLAPEVNIYAYANQIGPIKLEANDIKDISNSRDIDAFITRMPNEEKSKQVEDLLIEAKQEGKSYGGLVELCIENAPKYLGQPIFKKFKSEMASALLSIGATSGVSFGDGFSVTNVEGTEFHGNPGEKQYGGVRGGITTGEPINFNIAFKPTATVMDHAKKGRHDPCIVPRAVPVVEAMAYLVILDQVLMQKTDKI